MNLIKCLLINLMFITVIYCKTNNKNKGLYFTNKSSNDKITGFYNDDDLEDYIIKNSKNKLSYSIFINNGRGFDKKMSFEVSEDDFDDVENALDNIFISNPRKGEIVIGSSCCASLKTSELNYYKFFNEINSWILYKSSISIIDSDFIPNIKIDYLDYSYTIEGKKINLKALKRNEEIKMKELNYNLFNSLFNKYKFVNDNKTINMVSGDLSFDDLSEMILFNPISKNNIDKYNDLAYYLGLSKDGNNCSIFLLKKIIEIYPLRIVAYLNLADSYYNTDNKVRAKVNYKKYVELMKAQGKDLKKIPQRVYERIK